MINKETFKEIIVFGSESEENKKKAIQGACAIIAILNSTDGKKLSKEELERVYGGRCGSWTTCYHHWL